MPDLAPVAASIVIAKDGPYVVSGLPITEQALALDADGNTWDYQTLATLDVPDSYALCRCGRSSNKPFCDGTHRTVGFDGTESADRRPFEEVAEHLEGPGLDVRDNRPLCAFARICDGHGGIWNSVAETGDEAKREIVAHQATYCPSGRLVAHTHDDDAPLELALDPSIVLLEDPQQDASGPIWVRGGVSITAADGTAYETRNRVTLCRCGQSSNKPFCDGTHAHVGFRAHADIEGSARD